jgi:hypothetical protein
MIACRHARASVGFASLPTPLTGDWREQGFPEHVTLLGRSFTRGDKWSAPLPGVAKQYREDRDRNALHLYVLTNGTWKIDHVDEANPERGLVFEHAIKDVSQTWWGAALFATGAVMLSAGLAYMLTRD